MQPPSPEDYERLAARVDLLEKVISALLGGQYRVIGDRLFYYGQRVCYVQYGVRRPGVIDHISDDGYLGVIDHISDDGYLGVVFSENPEDWHASAVHGVKPETVEIGW